MNKTAEQPQLRQKTGDLADDVAPVQDVVDSHDSQKMHLSGVDGSLPEHKQWKLFVESGSAGSCMGFVTLLVTTPKLCGGEGFVFGRPGVILGVILGFSAQTLMPLALFWHTWRSYSLGFCPGTADVPSKLAMHAVASLYLARLSFRTLTLFREFVNPDRRQVKFDDTSLLSMAFLMDWSYTSTWEGAIYILNLWLTYTLSTSTPDIIFNALAAEFITSINDEIVQGCLKLEPIDGTMFEKANHRKPHVALARFVKGCVVVSSLASLCYVLIAAFAFLLAAGCKP